MSSENDTSGAHAGVTTAMVTRLAHADEEAGQERADGFARPPMITTAKTTPSQAQIWAGARVEMRAMKTPATPA